MPEATNHPAEPQGAAASLPAAPPPADAPKAYSSLSLLAVGGFVLALAYAAVVVVGGLIGVFYHTPWLLQPWSLLVPLAAAALCYAARARVRNSEGALTGMRLANWGVGVGLVVAVLYGAYYAGSYYARSSQAVVVADRYFDLLKKGDLDQAFLMTLPPPRPAADDRNLRDRLEIEFDRGPMGEGQLTDFRRSQLVRQFEQAGESTRVRLVGVQRWGYENKAYQVELAYSVATPETQADLVVTVAAVDGDDDSGGRQWYVRGVTDASPPALTAEGRRMEEEGAAARVTAQRWLDEVAHWRWDKAYLDTLPKAEREAQGRDRGPAFQKGLDAFRKGDLARIDDKFWAPAADKEMFIGVARGLFGRGGESPDDTVLGMRPSYRRTPDEARFGFDVTFRIRPLSSLIQGRLNVVADARDGQPAADAWRVESLDLIAAKSLPAAPPGPAMPRPGP